MNFNEITLSNDISGCFYTETGAKDNHVTQGEKHFKDIETLDECQKKCQENDECKYFVLRTKHHKGCWLKTAGAKQTITKNTNDIFGPKFCPGTPNPVFRNIKI